MEFLKTKTEKEKSAEIEAKKIFEQIKNKLATEDKVKIKLDRNDFKKELSTNIGFGFQDLKKKYKLLVTDLVANYNVKFKLDEMKSFDEFSVIITVSKKV
ncbi:MAG: hypothetical protein HPY57_14210 [Ignavibacteria bacterium]|nr:hypothetical protein [Ignavibacteria bacterium]